MVDINSRMPMNVGLRFSECFRFGHSVPKLPFLSCLIQAKTSATETSTKGNAIDQFLGIECSSETKCNEAPEEAPSQSMEKFLQFSKILSLFKRMKDFPDFPLFSLISS